MTRPSGVILIDYDSAKPVNNKKPSSRQVTFGGLMSEVVRLYRYKGLLSSRRAVSAEDLMTALELSRATLRRDMAKLRDQLHVPIDVQVMAPPALRTKVQKEFLEAAAKYVN